MDNTEMQNLSGLLLAPWIQKASALVGVKRKVGGNQFRHCMAAMTILIDYHFVDGIILKASIIHDLIEDFKEVNLDEIRSLDADAPEVLVLVDELSRNPKKESKEQYFERLIHNSSPQAKIVKLADRISNLTDLHLFVFTPAKTKSYLEQTEKYIYPMIDKLLEEEISGSQKKMVEEMRKEIIDLVMMRTIYMEEFRSHESIRKNLLKRLRIRQGKMPED